MKGRVEPFAWPFTDPLAVVLPFAPFVPFALVAPFSGTWTISELSAGWEAPFWQGHMMVYFGGL